MSKGNSTGIRFVEPPVHRKIVVSLLCPACGSRQEKLNVHVHEDATESLPFVIVTFGCVRSDCGEQVDVRVENNRVEIRRSGA